MNNFVTEPDNVTPEEVKAAERIDKEQFDKAPLLADIIKDKGNTLTEAEVRAIGSVLDGLARRPVIRLLARQPHIAGSCVERYVAVYPDASQRTAQRGADFVCARIEDAGLPEHLEKVVPVIPGSPCQGGSVDLGALAVPEFSSTIDPKLITAAAALADITTVGDAIGVFEARAALVSRWAAGEFRFTSDRVETLLYCLLREPRDLTDADRRGVQARVFGTPGAPAGTEANPAFPALFQGLVTALVSFDREQYSTGYPAGRTPSPAQARVAAEEVRYNLDQAVTGVTGRQIRDLRAELDRALFLLKNDEVIQQVAGGDRDGIWAVVSRLVDRNGAGSRDLVAQFAAMKARRAIFAWLEFEPGVGGDPEKQAFEAAVEAAVTLRALESVPQRQQIPATMNGTDGHVPQRLTTMAR
ncbi:hypothetical protein [Actinoplanes sp. NPDC020271]|uniref:hypothetical protein n=1 Tax=Actinoplanes sp. NPDC020271 TaxID=3363896 RepID=UPI00379B4EC0